MKRRDESDSIWKLRDIYSFLIVPKVRLLGMLFLFRGKSLLEVTQKYEKSFFKIARFLFPELANALLSMNLLL